MRWRNLIHARTRQRTTRVWMGMRGGEPAIAHLRIEEWPVPAPADFGAPWGYEPVAPFQFCMFDDAGRVARTLVTPCESLTDAVNEFARWALPPRQGMLARIIDESFRQVLGASWSTEPSETGTSAWDIGGAWYGCQTVFDVMRRQRVADDVSTSIWETVAAQTAPGAEVI